MKKIICLMAFICVIITSISCQKKSSSSSLNPPTWIQGYWKPATLGSGFRFTVDDVFTTTYTNGVRNADESSFKVAFGSLGISEEVISSVSYRIEYGGSVGQVVQQTFTKTGTSTMTSEGIEFTPDN